MDVAKLAVLKEILAVLDKIFQRFVGLVSYVPCLHHLLLFLLLNQSVVNLVKDCKNFLQDCQLCDIHHNTTFL